MPLGAFKAALMGTAGVSTDSVVLLSTSTASNSASLAITSGIDSTYGEYIFKFYNINPATDAAGFSFQVNASGESGYNETVTTTIFAAQHNEADDTAELGYAAGNDQAQGTAYIDLSSAGIGNGSDECLVGELHLFNPSSTTYAKQFYATTTSYSQSDLSINSFLGGYINTTTAVDEISFKMSSGNFDGKIKMW